MLPRPLQFIIAMVAYAINERMARRFDYLLEEVRALREVHTETTGRKRIPFTIGCRRFLRSAQDRLPPPKASAS